MSRFNPLIFPGIPAIIIVLLMTVLDVTIVNVALPSMAREFGVSDSRIVLVVSIYQLVITMLLLPVSSLGDKYSHRAVMCTGVVIFTLASALCAASGSFVMLVTARVLQGIGGACIMGVNIALMRIIYPMKYLARGMALNSMVIAVATAAGPTLAGALIAISSWHWIFLINVPLAFLAFAAGLRRLPKNPHHNAEPYDWISAIENVCTFGFIIIGLGRISDPEHCLSGALCIAVGLGVGSLYWRRQRDHATPLLPVDLLKIKLYVRSLITSICSYLAQSLTLVALPFLLSVSLGYSAAMTGLLITPWPITSMIISPIAARLCGRRNPAVIAAVGLGIFVVGIILIVCVPADGGVWNVVWRVAVCGLGFGIFHTPNNLVLVQATPLHRTGGSGGLQSTGRLLGQSLGATFAGAIFLLLPQGAADRTAIAAGALCALAAMILSLTRAAMARPASE